MRTRRTAWMAGVSLCLLVLVGCGAPAPSVPPKPIRVRFTVTDLGIVPPYYYADVAPVGGALSARARETLPSLDRALPILASRGSPSPVVATATPTVVHFPNPNVPSGVAGINRYGQVAGNLGTMAFLWTPTTPNGTTGQLMDFSQVFSSQSTRIRVDIGQINDYGQVAGGVRIEQTNERPFLWTPNTPNGVTGALTYLDPGDWVSGLNDWGQVAINDHMEGWLWTPTVPNGTSGVMTAIAPLSGDFWDEVLGINTYGQVIGDSYDIRNDIRYGHAFVWTPSTPHGAIGTMTTIGSDGFDVTAINDYGQVLGSIYPSKGFIRTPAYPNSTSGHLTTIAPLFNDGELDLYHINSSGVAVGTSFGSFRPFQSPGSGNDYAVVWRPAVANGTAGKLLVLGAVGNDADSHAEAVNSSGEVVGFSCTERHDVAPLGCSTPVHVFIWDDVHGLHDLQGLLDLDARMTLGSSIATIASVNDAGQIVTEGQARDGQTHLLLLTPQP